MIANFEKLSEDELLTLEDVEFVIEQFNNILEGKEEYEKRNNKRLEEIDQKYKELVDTTTIQAEEINNEGFKQLHKHLLGIAKDAADKHKDEIRKEIEEINELVVRITPILNKLHVMKVYMD